MAHLKKHHVPQIFKYGGWGGMMSTEENQAKEKKKDVFIQQQISGTNWWPGAITRRLQKSSKIDQEEIELCVGIYSSVAITLLVLLLLLLQKHNLLFLSTSWFMIYIILPYQEILFG